MIKKIVISLFVYVLFLPGFAQSFLTAPQVLSKAAGVITGAKGIETKFSISNSGLTGSGLIKSSGNKFNITLPDIEVWYNGKDMYTYNKRSGETIVVVPTSEELSETNPLAYVTGAAQTYNVSFSTIKKNGRYVLELLPKSKNSEVKRITLTLTNNDFVPEKIVVEPKKGNPVTAEILSFKTNVSLQNTEFEYPKSKYPKIEIVDLR